MDDDDEEFLMMQDAAALSWRGDPSSNWSDWTIVITSGEAAIHTYHVHRNILAAGPRRCEYFRTLFSTQVGVKEQQDNTSRIPLWEEDAAVFPEMLDFLYCEGTLNVSVDNVVALRSVARYFQCRELMRHVNEFVRQDLTMETAVLYLRNAFQRDDKLERACLKLICENIYNVPVHSMDTLPTELFQSIVCCQDDIKEEHHKFVSMHVKSFLDVNPDVLSAKLLNELTDHLVEIDASVAHGFLEVIGGLAHPKDDEDEHESWLALDRLSRACATALASGWKDLDTSINGMERFLDTEGDYRGSGRCVVPLLEACLEKAQLDYKQAKEECDTLKQQNQVLTRKVSSLMSQVSAVETLGDRLRAFRIVDVDAFDSDSSSDISSSSSSTESFSEDDDVDSSDESLGAISDWTT